MYDLYICLAQDNLIQTRFRSDLKTTSFDNHFTRRVLLLLHRWSYWYIVLRKYTSFFIKSLLYGDYVNEPLVHHDADNQSSII